MVVVGTSGFFYYDWRGIFYPETLSPSRWLEFYASKLNGLEVNASFYKLPTQSSVRNYKKFKNSLKFVFKLHRGITHKRLLREEFISPFLKVKELLGESLYCFLAQFPASFKPTERNKEFLLELITAFDGVRLVFELRNGGWKEEREWLEENGIVVCRLDFPTFKGWFEGGIFSEDTAYFRLHGRRKLYNDSYDDRELSFFAREILSCSSEHILCFFNNTPKAKGALNALRLLEILKEKSNSINNR